MSGLTSFRPTPRDWSLATRDISRGLSLWEIWTLLGWSDIRQRYLRSRFGQFWITLSMAVFIGGLGLVYGGLFHQNMHDYIPYLAVNIIVWTFISGTIGESTTVFTQSAVYLRQDAIPKTVFVLRLLVRQLITLAHNVLIIPIVFLITMKGITPVALLAIPGLVILLLALFLVSLNLGILATRFRDLPQIVTNALQLLFFVTPIMWRADQMGPDRQKIVILNPIAALLRLVSEPLLGQAPVRSSWALALLFIVVLGALTLPLFARFRGRLVYWL